MASLTQDKVIQRSALALNNKAVSLLNQGQFRAARKAFNASLSALEPLLHPKTLRSSSQPDDDEEETVATTTTTTISQAPNKEEKHHKSKARKHLRKREQKLSHSLETSSRGSKRRKLAKRHNNILNNNEKPSSACTAAPMLTTATKTTCGNNNTNNRRAVLPFDIHVLEDCDLSSMRYALQYGCSHSVFFVVILRDENCEDNLLYSAASCSDLARQHAIILYNRAVACMLCYEQQRMYNLVQQYQPQQQQQQPHDGPTYQQHLLRLARKSLSQADSVLSRASQTILMMRQQEQQQQPQQREPDCWTRVQFMLVSGLVLNFVSFLYMECQKQPQAQMALQAVDNLSTVLDQYPSLLFDPSHSSPAA